MTNLKTFKKEIAQVRKLWHQLHYDEAIAKIEELRAEYPGNPQLLVMWASLLQLQEVPDRPLDDAKEALRQAIDFDESSPAAAIELGHFIDAVEDDPKAAATAYSQAALQAKKLLIDALIGQSKSLLQLDRRLAAVRCLLEALQLSKLDYPVTNGKSTKPMRQNSVPAEIERLLNNAMGQHDD
jgi:tetratricopeptide (TPR) repeat protein